MTARGSGDAEVFASWPETPDPAGRHVSSPEPAPVAVREERRALGSPHRLLEVSFFFLETESVALDLGCVQKPMTRFSYI